MHPPGPLRKKFVIEDRVRTSVFPNVPNLKQARKPNAPCSCRRAIIDRPRGNEGQCKNRGLFFNALPHKPSTKKSEYPSPQAAAPPAPLEDKGSHWGVLTYRGRTYPTRPERKIPFEISTSGEAHPAGGGAPERKRGARGEKENMPVACFEPSGERACPATRENKQAVKRELKL